MPNITAGSVGDDTSLYVIGGHRLVDEKAELSETYETRATAHRFDADSGTWSELPNLPVEREMGGGTAFLTDRELFVITQDCEASGNPEGAGFLGCATQDVPFAGFRLDLAEGEWSSWDLPGRLTRPAIRDGGGPDVVPGAWTSGDPIFIAVPPADPDSLTSKVFAFDPVEDSWTSHDHSLMGPCSTGDTLVGFASAGVRPTVADLQSTPPIQMPSTVSVPVAEAGPAHQQVDRGEVTVDPEPLVASTDAADAMHAACLNGGVLLGALSPASPTGGDTWQFLADEATAFEQIQLAPSARDPDGYRRVTTSADSVFVATVGSSQPKASDRQEGRVARFDVARRAFEPLPPIPRLSVDYYLPLGTGALAAYPAKQPWAVDSSALVLEV